MSSTAAGVATPVDDGVVVLTSYAELDAKLDEIDEAFKISDDAMRIVFRTFRMTTPTDLPPDPTSAAYAEHQFALYNRIAEQAEYQVENERCDYQVDPNRPFPYYTASYETVGHQLMAMGYIILTMALPAGASVLELGPGWGNTTVALARMGYDVTAVDIDPNFVGLIGARAAKFDLSIDVRRGGFLEIEQIERRFDAVLFFECFHHCSDHRTLMQKLANMIVPGGRVFLAAEPIDDSFPVPWGLRLDGESLWAIRRNGWLELGFQESYFLRAMQEFGWLVLKHVAPSTHLGVVFEARRAEGVYPMSTFRLPPDEDATWAPADGPGAPPQRYTAARSVITLERNRSDLSIALEVVNPSPAAVGYRVSHGAHHVEGRVGGGSTNTIELGYDPDAAQLVIETTTWRPSDLLGSTDTRELGLGVRTISLVPVAR